MSSTLRMHVDKRTIGKLGVQMFGGKWFQHEAMSEFKGESIEIRYSDNDYLRVWAALPNGKIVECVCIIPGLITPKIVDDLVSACEDALKLRGLASAIMDPLALKDEKEIYRADYKRIEARISAAIENAKPKIK